jgi:hypothetical protein
MNRVAFASEDFLDSVDDHLKFAAANGYVSGRLSGQMNLEEYYVQQPPPGLIQTNNNFLANPSLTLNLDVQAGPQIYLFGEVAFDRGYDPTQGSAQIDAIQYAMRYTPWEDGRFNLQLGKFPTVVGNWSRRHDPWENPFITPPLVYENLTAVWGTDAAVAAGEINGWTTSAKNLRLPVIWDANYTTGAAIFGSIGKFDYAAEIKNAAISSGPGSWNATSVGFANPTYSGRLGFRPTEAWNLGVSSSVGSYLDPRAASSVAPGQGLDDYKEVTVAQDASYAWHHWQVWAECYETRFQIPTVANADTVAYYIETKYKFSPEMSCAVRWNQQLFGTIPDGMGGATSWGSNAWDVDVAFTYRFSPHVQAKLQYSFLDQGAPVPEQQSLVAGQLTVRF